MTAENCYLRTPGYAERYRDQRFATGRGSGAGTHRREVQAIQRLLDAGAAAAAGHAAGAQTAAVHAAGAQTAADQPIDAAAARAAAGHPDAQPATAGGGTASSAAAATEAAAAAGHAAAGHAAASARPAAAAADLAAAVDPAAGVRPWLDLPCGAGRLTDLLPGPAVRIDRDLAMLRACPPRQPPTPRLCASAMALPCADESFAGALCMRLLHHLPAAEQRVAVLRELRRVTRHGGPVLVSFFHAPSLQHARRVLGRRFGRRRSQRSAITARRFRAELEAAGLHWVRAQPLRRFVSEQWIVWARAFGHHLGA